MEAQEEQPATMTADEAYSHGEQHYDRHQFLEAKPYFERALQLYDNPKDVAKCHGKLGNITNTLNRFEEALSHYQEALTIYTRNESEHAVNIANTYNNMAGVFQNKGELDEAMEYYEKSLVIERKNGMEDTISIADTYNNMAIVFQNKGELDEAMEYYEKSLVIKRKNGMEDTILIAGTYHNMAGVFQNKGQLDEAIEYYEKSLVIYRNNGMEDTISIAGTYNNMGSLFLDKNDQSRAREHLSKAHDILTIFRKRDTITPNHSIFIKCIYHLGKLEITVSDFSKTLSHCEYIIQHVPKYKWAYLLKAQALQRLTQYDEAIAVYHHVLAKDFAPNYADAWIGLLKLLNTMEKLAIEREEAAKIKAENEIKEAQDDVRNVRETFQRSIEAARNIDPTMVDAADLEVRQELNDSDQASGPTASVSKAPSAKLLGLPANEIITIESLQRALQKALEESAMMKEMHAKVDLLVDLAQDAHRKLNVIMPLVRDLNVSKSEPVPEYFIILPKTFPSTPLSKSVFYTHPKNWVKHQVQVYWVCPVTMDYCGQGHPFTMTKSWVKDYGPILMRSLTALKYMCLVGRLAGLPFPRLDDIVDNTKKLVERRVEFLTRMVDHVKDEMRGADLGNVVEEYESAIKGRTDEGRSAVSTLKTGGDDDDLLDVVNTAGVSDGSHPTMLKSSYDQVKSIVGAEGMGKFSGMTLAHFRGDEDDENRRVRAYVKNDAEIVEMFYEFGDECFGLGEEELKERRRWARESLEAKRGGASPRVVTPSPVSAPPLPVPPPNVSAPRTVEQSSVPPAVSATGRTCCCFLLL